MSYFSSNPRGIYRSRDGLFLGVCKGIADWRDMPVFWIRFAVVVFMFTTAFWPVFIAYLFIAFLMKAEPAVEPQNIDEQEFYDSYAHSRKQALHRLKTVFDQLDRRTRRMENIITSKEYDWQHRFDKS